MSTLFEELKIIDAASFLAGPCAATIFADYGADVVKIEPLNGDRHRSIAAGHPSDYSWQLTNRNKRALALDFSSEEGQVVLAKMLKQADILLVNFSAAQLEKFNLTWDQVHKINPKLILAQISAYGLHGDDANRRAFDLTGWFARTGILDMMHEKDIAPALPAGGVGDHATGMTLFAGIMMALHKRTKTGEGSMVTTSLAATGAWANGLNLQAVFAGIDGAARRDDEGWSNPVQNIYTTADNRHILIALQNVPRDWPKFVEVLNRPEWLEDEKLQPVKPLFRNRFYAKEQIQGAFSQLTSGVLCERLDQAGLVFSLCYKNAEVIEDPQLLANEVIVPSHGELPGNEQTFAMPMRLNTETPIAPHRAPEVGQHSAEVLSEFGFSDNEIDDLRSSGLVS